MNSVLFCKKRTAELRLPFKMLFTETKHTLVLNDIFINWCWKSFCWTYWDVCYKLSLCVF